MTVKPMELRLQAQFEQCARLAAWLSDAGKAVAGSGPLTVDRVAAPSPTDADLFDLLLYRYMRMQDALGGRLLPTLLEAGGELPVESAYIDKLNQLERLGIVGSAARWMELRALRNRMAHDYPDSDVRLGILREALTSVPELLATYTAARRYASEKLGLALAVGTPPDRT